MGWRWESLRLTWYLVPEVAGEGVPTKQCRYGDARRGTDAEFSVFGLQVVVSQTGASPFGALIFFSTSHGKTDELPLEKFQTFLTSTFYLTVKE